MSAETCIMFRGPYGLDCRPHVNSELEVIFATQGSIEVCVCGLTLCIQTGEAVFIFPYQPHSFHPQEGATGRVYMFSYRIAADFYNTHNADGIPPFCFSLPEALMDFLQYTQTAAEAEPNEIYAKSLFFPLAAEYLKNIDANLTHLPGSQLVNQIMDYISNHLQDKITLKMLSAHFGINTIALSKLIKAYTYSSFTDFVNNIRIEKALSLFYEQDVSVTEAAYQSGFGSVRNFNRVFYSTVGITPSEYRRNKKR